MRGASHQPAFMVSCQNISHTCLPSLCEMCPNTEYFSGPYFPAFGLNTERYEVCLHIQSKCGKIWTRKNSVFGFFSRSACLPSRWVSPCILFPPYDWANGRSINDFYICYYCFSSMGSWCYSVKWVWDSRTKLCCIAFRKWNVSRVSLQKFGIRYIIFTVTQVKHTPVV